jgi:hypothetical protein
VLCVACGGFVHTVGKSSMTVDKSLSKLGVLVLSFQRLESDTSRATLRTSPIDPNRPLFCNHCYQTPAESWTPTTSRSASSSAQVCNRFQAPLTHALGTYGSCFAPISFTVKFGLHQNSRNRSLAPMKYTYFPISIRQTT